MSTLFQGAINNALDFQVISIDSGADLTPTGVFATTGSGNLTGLYPVVNGLTIVNFSGNITAVLPSGIETITQALFFKNSPAQSGTTVISGTTAAQTIDGALTYSLAGINSHVKLQNYSGSAWVTI